MMYRQLWWLAVGALGGLIGARMLARPGGRRALKSVVRKALVVQTAIEGELALARESLADLVAEAREEHRRALDEEQRAAQADG